MNIIVKLRDFVLSSRFIFKIKLYYFYYLADQEINSIAIQIFFEITYKFIMHELMYYLRFFLIYLLNHYR